MLETEIVRLINAVDKLTEAMGALTGEVCARRVTREGGEVPETEEAPKEPKLKVVEKEQAKPDTKKGEITEQDLKDRTLAKSRAGHRDAIRAKLDELGYERIQLLKGEDKATFYDWLGGLEDK